MTAATKDVGGILLTGGTSRRMGEDKATIVIEGETLAERLGRLLLAVAPLAVEVGPGHSGLPVAPEGAPGSGPLGGIVAGFRALRNAGHEGPALVVACDLPLLTAAVLRRLAEWPGSQSVLPTADGDDQPLCARWSLADLESAQVAFARGDRSLRRIPDRSLAVILPPDAFDDLGGQVLLKDVDTPEDLASVRTGLDART